jgi:hypothetical protein
VHNVITKWLHYNKAFFGGSLACTASAAGRADLGLLTAVYCSFNAINSGTAANGAIVVMRESFGEGLSVFTNKNQLIFSFFEKRN